MSDIIYHHYPESPFAEKIRLVLGYKQLAWKSVTIPVIMPKPDLTALTGGYRRTPVLQMGNDVYCDTALIAEVLERMVPVKSLFPNGSRGQAETIAQWADSVLFMTAVGYVYQVAGMEAALAKMPPEQRLAFQQDRAALLGNKTFPGLAECTASLSRYLQRLTQMLQGGQPFLLGSAATLADFSCYHPLWFIRATPPAATMFAANPLVLAWMDRMQAIGHGRSSPMTGDEALAVARGSSAAAIESEPGDLAGIALGDQVVIMPSDYGIDPVAGELILVRANEVAVRRSDERAGTVVVHFPRIGYQIKKAAANS